MCTRFTSTVVLGPDPVDQLLIDFLDPDTYLLFMIYGIKNIKKILEKKVQYFITCNYNYRTVRYLSDIFFSMATKMST
jgi:hypothetical protein